MASKKKLVAIRKGKKMTVCRTSKGKLVTFLTPSGKFDRYTTELRNGKNVRTKQPLTALQRGYRMGYNAALGEQAAIYNSKKK